MDTTISGYAILGWRGLEDGEEAAWIMGRGWCRYSRKLSALLIDGEWHTY